jgi:hypothetical protein
MFSPLDMQSFFDWFSSEPDHRNRAWVMLGKGPTFVNRSRFDLGQYYTLSLNHVVRELPVTVAHMIDLDVVDACGDALLRNARVVVLPWFPHIKNGPSSESLDELVPAHPILSVLREQQRLLWYNLSTGPRVHPGSPVVLVRFFSAEAALKLLALAGVRTVRSLGVDGGASYSTEFQDLSGKTLLANKRSTFNRQFEEIASTLMQTGIDYAPLDVDSPVRVYVAATDAQMLSVKVLEFSIRRHASMTVQVVPLHEGRIDVPVPRDPKNRARTPFSFQRFLIPALAQYHGRAIYLDSDMQVFKDIRGLWTMPFGDAEILTAREVVESSRRPQFSVMLLDCERLKWNVREIVAALDRGELDYEQLMYEMKVAKKTSADIDPAWNSLERYREGETALLHYTDMTLQPWVSRDNPLGYLWVRELRDAIAAGFITLDFVREHVSRGYVRPSLVYQIEHEIDNGLLLPKAARDLDRGFRAPYMSLDSSSSSRWRHPLRFMRAVLRHVYERSPLPELRRRVRDRLST